MSPDALTLKIALFTYGKCAYTFLCHQLNDNGMRTVLALEELVAAKLAERRTLTLSTGHQSTHWYPVGKKGP